MDPLRVGASSMKGSAVDGSQASFHPLQQQRQSSTISPEPSAPMTPRGPREEVQDRFSDVNLPPSAKLSVAQVPRSLEGLKRLAQVGSWVSFLQLSESLVSETKNPHEKLHFQCCRLIGLFRLKRYSFCEQYFNDLGDLNDPKHRFETYPEYFENKTGSMIPFTLRLLHAEIPHRTGTTLVTLDRLYQLLTACEREKSKIEKEVNDILESLNKKDEPKENQKESTTEAPKANETPEEKKTAPEPLPKDESQEVSSLTPKENEGDEFAEKVDLGDEEVKVTGDSNSELDIKEVGEELPLDDDGLASQAEKVIEDIMHSGDFLSAPKPPELPPQNQSASDQQPVVAEDHQARLSAFGELQSALSYRIARIQFSIANHHIEMKDYYSALLILSNMAKQFPSDPYILACIGKCYITLGDSKAAENICKRMELLFSSPETSPLVRLMKGFLCISQGQFMPAYDHFQAASALNPLDPSVINNVATCCLYVGQLSRAVETLEGAIKRDPNRFVTEPIVFNLCTLYEMYENPTESKKSLQTIVVNYGSDDFDQSVLRLA